MHPKLHINNDIMKKILSINQGGSQDEKEAVLPNQQPSRYAVLVGCNYPNTDYKLDGCVSDVKRMKNALLKRFGFREDNIRMLIDTDPASEQPTSDNIMESLQKMIHAARPGDVLLFYYSGHGSRTPCLWDETGHEEFIIPCDFEVIIDSDFRELVNKLPKRTSFTIVSDSCHSGGLIEKQKEQIGPLHKDNVDTNKRKNVVTKPRFIEPKALKIHRHQIMGSLHKGLRKLKKVDLEKGILLSGCQSDEKSSDSRSGGVFSNALQQVLAKHQGPISNKDLVLQAAYILGNKGYKQHPCLYCSDHNATAMFLQQSQNSLAKKSKFSWVNLRLQTLLQNSVRLCAFGSSGKS